MLTAHRSPSWTASASWESACTQNNRVGGSRETETTDVAVIARSRFPWRTVTTQTPDARRAIANRNSVSASVTEPPPGRQYTKEREGRGAAQSCDTDGFHGDDHFGLPGPVRPRHDR